MQSRIVCHILRFAGSKLAIRKRSSEGQQISAGKSSDGPVIVSHDTLGCAKTTDKAR